MAYVTIPPTASDPDAPLTSQLIKQIIENPIGIARGDAGAPKIFYRRDMKFVTVNNGYAPFWQVAGYSSVYVSGRFYRQSGSGLNTTLEYSTNGGTSWGTPINLYIRSNDYDEFIDMHIPLQTGSVELMRTNAETGVASQSSIAVTVPNGVNAIRLDFRQRSIGSMVATFSG